MQIVSVFLLVSASVCLALADVLPSSEFAYGVSNPATGDQKDQQEVRVGDAVSGYYRTLDSDGLLRTVNYKADPLNGFIADVKRVPASAPLVYKSIAPAAIYKTSSFAPVYYNGYAAPVLAKSAGSSYAYATSAIAPAPYRIAPYAPLFRAASPVYSYSTPLLASAGPYFAAPAVQALYK